MTHKSVVKVPDAATVLALIPARGGSKSIPRKNIIDVAGKPMIAWTIEVALKSSHITRTIVTTDDPGIADIARQYGAEVPFLRPVSLAGDASLDIEFHRHALKWLAEHEGYEPDLVVNLRPTTPSRQADVIDRAIEIFESNPQADSLRSVHMASQTPFKMWTIDSDGLLNPVARLDQLAEPYNAPRQQLPPVYWQDGYVDITRPSVILEKHSTTGDLILPFVVEEPQIDVDYPEDLMSAEAKMCQSPNPRMRPSTADETMRYPS